MKKLRTADIFAGIGGFSLGLEKAGGFETVMFCETNKFCQRVLARHWPEVPCHDDVSTLQLTEGFADVITGGFPCQDVSKAGKRAGITGKRSGLYRELMRTLRMVRPGHAIVENVAELLNFGMGVVLGDLAASGFDAEWDCVPAAICGAPHRRDRVIIVAHADRKRQQKTRVIRPRKVRVSAGPAENQGPARGAADPDSGGRGAGAAGGDGERRAVRDGDGLNSRPRRGARIEQPGPAWGADDSGAAGHAADAHGIDRGAGTDIPPRPGAEVGERAGEYDAADAAGRGPQGHEHERAADHQRAQSAHHFEAGSPGDAADAPRERCGQGGPWRPFDSFARVREQTRRHLADPYGSRLAFREGIPGDAWEKLTPAERSAIQHERESIWPDEPALSRVDDGVSHWMDRTVATGNAVVPDVVRLIGLGIMDLEAAGGW